MSTTVLVTFIADGSRRRCAGRLRDGRCVVADWSRRLGKGRHGCGLGQHVHEVARYRVARRCVLHVISAIGFAIGYTLLMHALGATEMPWSAALGAGVGFLHGLIVSLGLVWVVAEQHPLEEFNEAGLAIGLSHIVGHVAYGAVVGLVVAICPALTQRGACVSGLR